MVEFFVVPDVPPGGAHTEAAAAQAFGPFGGGFHLFYGHEGVLLNIGVVASGLWAVAAVLGATTGFDAEQAGHLHLVRVVVGAVDRGGAEDEVH